MEEEEHVEGPQPESLHGEEIRRGDLLAVVAQEGPPGARPSPALGSRWHAVAPEDGADGRASCAVAELDQLPLDPEIAPGGVLLSQADDERIDVGRDGRPPARTTAAERPRATDQLAVPAQDGLGREEHQALPPRRAGAVGVPPERSDHDRESQLLPARRAYSAGLGAVQDAELVAQQEDLELLLPRIASSTHGEVEQPRWQGRQHAVDHETSHSFLISAERIKRTGIPVEQPLVDSRSGSTTRVFA
jgi:hypothetical protein